MDCGRFRPAINHTDPDKQVFRSVLGIFYEDIEVAVFVEDTRLQQFVLHVATITPPVRLDQVVIGKLGLGVLVQILHVGMRGRAVKVEVVFLDIFTVVALTVRQTEQTLFKDGVLAIPKGHAEAQKLLVIAYAGKTILPPVIGTGSGLIMTEIVPGISVLAVVFPYPIAAR
jgi:hypothetical protein